MFSGADYRVYLLGNPVGIFKLILELTIYGVPRNSLHRETKGAFTRQRKNGTGPTKTGTVQIVFAKKQ